MANIDYQINNVLLFPYQFALQHFQAFSQEASWNGRAVVHLVLGILEILPTGINYIIAIVDAVFNRNPPQAPIQPNLEQESLDLISRPFTHPVPVTPGWPSLPTDLIDEFSTHLTPKELGCCTSVCKGWGKYINQNNKIWNWQAHRAGIISSMIKIGNPRQLFAKPSIAFGRGEWLRYVGDPGKVPPLPSNIYEILQSPCPFWPEKRIKETHILVLIPQTITKIVDSQPVTYPLTFNTFNQLLQSSNNYTRAKCIIDLDDFLLKYGDVPIARSHWVLMTNALTPLCMNPEARYSFKKSLIENRGYEVPNYLDTIISILMQNIHSGQNLFAFPYRTFCQETVNDGETMCIVGSFRSASQQLEVSGSPVQWYIRENCALCSSLNLAAVRKFY